jgi:hypothetical protein
VTALIAKIPETNGNPAQDLETIGDVKIYEDSKCNRFILIIHSHRACKIIISDFHIG